MKKIIFVVAIIIAVSLPSVALNKVQEGIWMSDINSNGNNISFSMKIESTSPAWNDYVKQKGYEYNNIDFSYALISYNINCSNESYKISAKLYDKKGNVNSTINMNNSNNNELKQNISLMCSNMNN